MKTMLTILYCITLSQLYGQDTLYYNNSMQEVTPQDSAYVYFRVMERDVVDTNHLIERFFFKSGQIKEEYHLSIYPTPQRNGPEREWFEHGQLKKELHYVNDDLDGNLLTFWENGQAKRVDVYKKHALISGKCFDSSGRIVDYYAFSQLPECPFDIYAYLGNNVKYPQKAIDAGITGRVVTEFLILKDGSVSSPKIVKGVHESLEQEALRVIRNMPKWKPAMVDGEPIEFLYTLPVQFSIR